MPRLPYVPPPWTALTKHNLRHPDPEWSAPAMRSSLPWHIRRFTRSQKGITDVVEFLRVNADHPATANDAHVTLQEEILRYPQQYSDLPLSSVPDLEMHLEIRLPTGTRENLVSVADAAAYDGRKLHIWEAYSGAQEDALRRKAGVLKDISRFFYYNFGVESALYVVWLEPGPVWERVEAPDFAHRYAGVLR